MNVLLVPIGLLARLPFLAAIWMLLFAEGMIPDSTFGAVYEWILTLCLNLPGFVDRFEYWVSQMGEFQQRVLRSLRRKECFTSMARTYLGQR